MASYDLWVDMIESKTYTKAVAIQRVSLVFRNMPEEKQNLLDLIERVYG